MAFFKRSSVSVGFDILDTELRAVLIRGNEGKDDDIMQHEVLPLPAGVVKNGRIVDAAKFNETVKMLLDKFPKGNAVIVALPPQTTYSVYLRDQKEAPKNKQVLQDIATEWFPVPPEELSMETQWFQTGNAPGSLGVFAVETKTLEAYKAAFRAAGANGARFFPRTLAMTRVAFGTQGTTQMTALLDLSLRPMVFSCILGNGIIDERLLFGEKVEEAYCETLASWSTMLEKTLSTPVVAGTPAPATPAPTAAAEPPKESEMNTEKPAPVLAPAPAPVPSILTFRIVVIGTNPMPFDPLCAKMKNVELKPEMLPAQEPVWLFARGLSALSQSKVAVPSFS